MTDFITDWIIAILVAFVLLLLIDWVIRNKDQ
jgi:hypothetical protein